FAVGGLIYSVLILWEVRMSPQLHATVYGASPRQADFAQAIRWGGYRPIVFMPHGLAVALFICNTVMAAFILARNRGKVFGLSWCSWCRCSWPRGGCAGSPRNATRSWWAVWP